MAAEPLLQWQEPVRELAGFLAQFLALGAVGFRYAAVGGRLTGAIDRSERAALPSTASGERAFFGDACARAALVGLAGFVVQAALFAAGLPKGAARAHTTVPALLTSNLATGGTALLMALGVVGLVVASARLRWGWPLAAAGVVLAPLTAILTGPWTRVVNPMHRVVAGLWLGTLLILVAVGLAMAARDERARPRRGVVVAEMVNGFSPLALGCGIVVILSGLITAWRHLNPLSSLFTTPYGWALLAKLAVVAVVFALGAWNWRKVRPTLGSESAAGDVRRSSTGELTAAAVVLAITAVLVSLPSPKPPKPPSAMQPAGAPAPAP